MDTELGVAYFIAQADRFSHFLLVVLLLMSLGSWYLVAVKGVALVQGRRRSRAFLAAFWAAPSLDAVARRMREQGVTDAYSHLVHHGFTAIEQHRHGGHGLIAAGTPDEYLSRALKRAIAQERTRLEQGQTFLATVASSAPFVGLLGTVWGIYHALIRIGLTGQGTLATVAGPVGEALIMTAIGLAVAIPAVIAYNAFARANRTQLADLDSFAHDVYTFMATGLKARVDADAVATTSERILAHVASAAAAAPARTAT